MRCARGLAPYLLALSACGGASAEPAPVTPAPVPEPADETEEAAEPAREAAAAPEPTPVDPEALAAVARLTAEPPLAYYLPGDGSALAARTAEIDGVGARVGALVVQLDGTSETVAIADEQGQRQLAARLAGKPLVELSYTPWPEGKRALELARPKLKVVWSKGGKLEARAGKKKVPIGASHPAAHVVRPAGLFASGESPVVLLLVETAAAEAGRRSTEVLRIDLPARKK